MPSDPSAAVPDLVGAVRAIAEKLEAAGVEYAVGGAIAYGYWGLPRATRDVDCTVFLPADGLAPALDALERAGCDVDLPRAQRDARDRGEFQARAGDIHVDVFVPSIPFYDEARRRRVQVDFAGTRIWIWSAETICVFKLLFFRSKDRMDVENLVRWGFVGLDRAFVRTQIAGMLGEDDERVRFWDEVTS